MTLLFTDLTGLAGNALALTAVAAWVSGAARISARHRIALSVVVFVVTLVPFGGLPLAGYVRGMIGDLSVTTLVLLAFALAGSLRKSHESSPLPPSRRWEGGGTLLPVQFLMTLAALWLYPMALGLGCFDPYRAGYGNPWLLAALLAIALAAWHRRRFLTATIITLAVLAWAAGWHESANLWDYLTDPLVALYAVGAVLHHLASRVFSRHR